MSVCSEHLFPDNHVILADFYGSLGSSWHLKTVRSSEFEWRCTSHFLEGRNNANDFLISIHEITEPCGEQIEVFLVVDNCRCTLCICVAIHGHFWTRCGSPPSSQLSLLMAYAPLIFSLTGLIPSVFAHANSSLGLSPTGFYFTRFSYYIFPFEFFLLEVSHGWATFLSSLLNMKRTACFLMLL